MKFFETLTTEKTPKTSGGNIGQQDANLAALNALKPILRDAQHEGNLGGMPLWPEVRGKHILQG